MAGSYQHVTDPQGRLLSPAEVAGMLDTPGDVYEAIQEMYAMIWYLANTRMAGSSRVPMVGSWAVIQAQSPESIQAGMNASPGLAADHVIEESHD